METTKDHTTPTSNVRPKHRYPLAGLALVALCMVSAGLHAQTVVSSSGGHASMPDATISWTIGEPVINTVSGGGNTLTQGFQQPWADISTVIGENAGSAPDIRVYPNPVRHVLNVDVPGDAGQDQLELLDAAGRTVLQTNTTGDHTELDLTRYGAGNYFLRVLNAEGIVSRTFKINITH